MIRYVVSPPRQISVTGTLYLVVPPQQKGWGVGGWGLILCKQITYDSNIKWHHKKTKAERKSARDLRNHIYGIYAFCWKSAEGLGSRRK